MKIAALVLAAWFPFAPVPHEKDPSSAHLVPKGVADLIAGHVQGILDAGYARQLSAEDFFHSHMLVQQGCPEAQGSSWRSWQHPPLGPDEWAQQFLASDPIFVYHTREYTGPRNPYSGPARSILAKSDSELFPMQAQTRAFRNRGLVYGIEAMASRSSSRTRHIRACAIRDRSGCPTGNCGGRPRCTFSRTLKADTSCAADSAMRSSFRCSK